jgi:hypothetical protein
MHNCYEKEEYEEEEGEEKELLYNTHARTYIKWFEQKKARRILRFFSHSPVRLSHFGARVCTKKKKTIRARVCYYRM